MSILQNSNAISAGGYDINNSLRFRSSASAYLSRTPASNGNRRTWTWSAWVKRGSLGSYQVLFGAGLNNGVNADELVSIYFTNSDQLGHYVNETGVADRNNYSTAVYRDPSAWYHIVAIYDSTQATAANRQRLFVNNVEITSWAATSYVSQNYQPSVNSTAYPHAIGKYGFNNTRYFDGYMTEVNFIDGQAITPSSFGETDTTTGSWKPKAYTGTYGTNGFYLKFSDIATTSGSNAGLGKDFSGNTNYWTTNNISVTSGTTYDAMTDSPTLTSATVANYCVMNPIATISGYTTTTNGNLTANFTSSGNGSTALGTTAITSGKYYWEIYVTAAGTHSTYPEVGIANILYNYSAAAGTSYLASSSYGYVYQKSGNKANNGSSVAYGSSWTTGDLLGVALDMDAGTITFYKNNVSQGTAYTGLSGTFYPAADGYASSGTVSLDFNFGQRPFSYTPPTGFVRLNTYNLPDSTIKKGNKYMDATLWTGGQSSPFSVTNAGSFKPDLVWAKERSSASSNRLYDSVRGTGVALLSNSTAAEQTEANTGVSAFQTAGFQITNSNGVAPYLNDTSQTYVAWQWQAGQGSTSSGTGTGGITSVTMSVNTTAGFSIVTYTGSGANGTVTHGLGVAPKMIIVKIRNGANNWFVWHTSLTSGAYYLNLDATSAQQSNSVVWNNTIPTSSVFSLGTSSAINGSTNTYVAYCWAEIAGFSKFGSYTGNGSTDGPFIYTGFRPKFIMVKGINVVTQWGIFDSSRNTYNLTNAWLKAENSAAEATLSFCDILSNGFKLREANFNDSGYNFLYIAFAENPFKNSNAR